MIYCLWKRPHGHFHKCALPVSQAFLSSTKLTKLITVMTVVANTSLVMKLRSQASSTFLNDWVAFHFNTRHIFSFVFCFIFVFVFVFEDSVFLGCPGNPLCRVGWPQIQRPACLCLPRAGITGICHHCPASNRVNLNMRCPSIDSCFLNYFRTYQKPDWNRIVILEDT